MPKDGLTLTRTAAEILAVLVDRAAQDQHSGDLSVATGLSAGTVYPVLARLEALQWVDSAWEQAAVHQQGWPRRRLYRLNPYGLAMARGALVHARASPFRRTRLRAAGETA